MVLSSIRKINSANLFAFKGEFLMSILDSFNLEKRFVKIQLVANFALTLNESSSLKKLATSIFDVIPSAS